MAKIKNQAYAQTGDFFTPIAEVTNTLEKVEKSPILIKKESSITDGETVVAGSPATYTVIITHADPEAPTYVIFDLTDALPKFFKLDPDKEIKANAGGKYVPFSLTEGPADEANNYTPYKLSGLYFPATEQSIEIIIPVVVAGSTDDLLPEAPVFGNSEVAE
ncbi:hypothetical protein [Candidatus Epulonipiscium viviparus]|uniref:hypothetical protein n=1 Tax=Candidatus Epulonipiscium viviparus TaxID=420336 RepID=UPI0027381410|nr:hypothetical protein [Candidatus Epulopiscium viviparus]